MSEMVLMDAILQKERKGTFLFSFFKKGRKKERNGKKKRKSREKSKYKRKCNKTKTVVCDTAKADKIINVNMGIQRQRS